jgi:NTP pyrophosphatase (non-canonical NTP hydrolase)
MKADQFDKIVQWQTDTFGHATALSKIAHLAEELQELVDDLKSNNPDKRLEFADCFTLLFGAAASDGMSYEQIIAAIDEKMAINYKRTWGKPDDNGVVHHT